MGLLSVDVHEHYFTSSDPHHDISIFCLDAIVELWSNSFKPLLRRKLLKKDRHES